jgi:two-component system, OmpR family, response regulator
MRVLVVEDNPKMADVLSRGLQDDGYAVDLAQNSEDALALATEITYDAIILDVVLGSPDADGIQVCQSLSHSTSPNCLPACVPLSAAARHSDPPW